MPVVRSRWTTAATLLVSAIAFVVVDAEMMPMESSTLSAASEADRAGDYYDPLTDGPEDPEDLDRVDFEEDFDIMTLAKAEAERESREAEEEEARLEETRLEEEEYNIMKEEENREMWEMDAEEEHLRAIILDAPADYVPENPKPENGILSSSGDTGSAVAAAAAPTTGEGDQESAAQEDVAETMSEQDIESTMRHVRQMREEREERRLRRRQRKVQTEQTPPPEDDGDGEIDDDEDDDEEDTIVDTGEPLEYLPDHGEIDPALEGIAVGEDEEVFKPEGQYDAAAYEAMGGDVVDDSGNVDVKAPKTTVHGIVSE